MPEVFKATKPRQSKKPKFYMVVRTYGDAPVCDCWLNLREGAASSEVMHGHKRREKIEALIEQLGDSIEVKYEDVSQWVGSESNQKESSTRHA